jgi:hypothetical protein
VAGEEIEQSRPLSQDESVPSRPNFGPRASLTGRTSFRPDLADVVVNTWMDITGTRLFANFRNLDLVWWPHLQDNIHRVRVGCTVCDRNTPFKQAAPSTVLPSPDNQF